MTEQARQGPLILSKTLLVTGPREWRRRSALLRALTLFVLPVWKLGTPQAITTLPLRYEYAYGGENKILETEPAAARVNKKYRLPGRKPLPESAPDGDMQMRMDSRSSNAPGQNSVRLNQTKYMVSSPPSYWAEKFSSKIWRK